MDLTEANFSYFGVSRLQADFEVAVSIALALEQTGQESQCPLAFRQTFECLF